MRMAVPVLILVATAACTSMPSSQSPDLARNEVHCVAPAGWDAISERDPHFVVFGELHGTREAPDFFGSLACNLASNGQRLLIGIEFSPIFEEALQEAWNADEAKFDSLLLEAGWKGREDGVASEAMFEMVRKLHRLKTAGHAIDITAFNGIGSEAQGKKFDSLPGQGPHEAAQAENLAMSAAAGRYDRVLVLVGNFHATRRSMDFGTGLFEPMAKRLEQYGSVVTLTAKNAPGTSWNCQRREGYDIEKDGPPTNDDIRCGARATGGIDSLGSDRFISLYENNRDPEGTGLDGFFWIGEITASPPQAPLEKSANAGASVSD